LNPVTLVDTCSTLFFLWFSGATGALRKERAFAHEPTAERISMHAKHLKATPR